MGPSVAIGEKYRAPKSAQTKTKHKLERTFTGWVGVEELLSLVFHQIGNEYNIRVLPMLKSHAAEKIIKNTTARCARLRIRCSNY
jgi:hypothetical protein